MARRNTAPRTPNHAPRPTSEAEPTNPTLRDLETLTLGEYLKGKLSYAMGQRAVARAEEAVDSRLDFIDQQLASGGTIPMHMATMNRSNRDELVDQHVQDKKNERQYKKEKRRYVLNRIGSAAMWVPGIDLLGDVVMEHSASRKLNKQRISAYRRRNGTFIGQLVKTHRNNQDKFAKKRKILDDFSELAAASRNRWQ